ncbi:OmpA family protein [Sphaerotilus uruguayifluvii]|uniref:Outer membrane protein OmpA-like peptidoglycan-associated protein n=1 Tax=Sphaerotilus uruguayifluvii TaxID=2735897 RepID=A0ABX2G2X5_9BURK|nr:OmpA family protein [Leptothrix sp. C29]NRT56651.1 outer membrane protein OmpA-like peptidoglycan-associated protein [Leptothrix sp. C29]
MKLLPACLYAAALVLLSSMLSLPPAEAQPSASASPTRPKDLVAPDPIRFEDAIARAGEQLLLQARDQLGAEARTLVIDPLIDANTGAQTASTVRMGEQLEALLRRQTPQWKPRPLTRQALADKPLLLIGTLTPVNVERAVDTVPDAFRVWLTLIDLRTGRVVAKQLDRSTVDSVNPEPLKFYADSPTWHKDRTTLGYINSCQVNTRVGDPADPDYLSRLPGAAVVNEAILAYGAGRMQEAHQLYREADTMADPGDLRVLNGLYLTSWKLGDPQAARSAFERIIATGLDTKRLPIKILFQPGRTSFSPIGDLPQQYQLWLDTLARETGRADACVRIVGHTSRTGSARANETLSRQRAEAVQKLLERSNRALGARLSAAGVGSREALVGLGTDDLRDALDRRVEFRVVDCV